MRKHTALAVVLALITSTASAADWFASPQGDDAKGTGAKEKPFRTILKGLERARAGDRVVLRAGEYRMRKRLQFPRAGEPGRAITLTAHADEYVALLGSVRLTGWERHEGKLWKAKSPSTFHHGITRGLYQDGERLTHPRPDWGKRKNPPVSELKTPGTWTQVDGWVYVRTREDDSPALHRIEASQHGVVVLNRDWLRIEKLHMFFGENTVCVIHGDHCEVVNCEIAHCSNSGGNAYCAYFSGCSNSASATA